MTKITRKPGITFAGEGAGSTIEELFDKFTMQVEGRPFTRPSPMTDRMQQFLDQRTDIALTGEWLSDEEIEEVAKAVRRLAGDKAVEAELRAASGERGEV